MKKRKNKLGITIGDFNGIGAEIIIKTFKDSRMMDFCTPIIFSSSKIISFYRKLLKYHDFNFNVINAIKDAHPKKVNLLNISNEDINFNVGESSDNSGKYAYKSIMKACEALKNDEINSLITAPINKLNIKNYKNDFIGHTELLGKEFEGSPLMMMVSDIMKITFITGHIPISKLKSSITTKNIVTKTKIFNSSLKHDFNVLKPKIAVLGLNPHAGENGMLGEEEDKFISPAIKELQKLDILAYGPFPADSFFSDKNLSFFDGIIAMYHDQGLIPFKTTSFTQGVNFTAGLNIIRTSPVHGTAYEITGKGIANENSFRQAVFLACDIYKNRSLNLAKKQ